MCEGKQTCFSLAESRSLSAAAPRLLSSPCSAWWGFPEYREGHSGGESPYNCPKINSPPLQKRARNWWCFVVLLPQSNGSRVPKMPTVIFIKKTLTGASACLCMSVWVKISFILLVLHCSKLLVQKSKQQVSSKLKFCMFFLKKPHLEPFGMLECGAY